MIAFRRHLGSFVAIAVALAPVAAAASESDLVGARASSGESQLESRGYVYITGSKDRDGTSHAYFWRARDRKCVHAETWDGRYTAVRDASAGDCNQKSGNGTAAAVAGVAVGALLIAALASHKQHHHDNDQHYSSNNDEAAYERGFNDGLHNVAYHNYDRSTPYSDGYSAGVAQREANTGYHSGRGGYAQTGQFMDLNGARASSADDSLRDRGFSNVDGFKSANTAYTIWYRRDSRQCLQMTVAEGRVYDIRDIGQHPRCR